ncbi:MAG: hypothetical protein C4576_00125 [Desulfobacteraceae bacterium]|nr:MAG: hypothetical protein C4576_00125 [Desulfobacteraceae bacterium]
MVTLEKQRAGRPARLSSRCAGQSYYGLPPIKHSYYGAKTAMGFFLQGIGGSAQMIAALGDLIGREENRNLIRAGRVLAFLASPGGPMFFVAALHTPRRWYNMLRIFRATSPMSIGIWTLAQMGLFNSLSLAGVFLERLGHERLGKWLDRIFGSFAAAAGGLVSLYMGSELEETSTPMWAGAFPLLTPFVGATGFSNGAAALSLATSLNGNSRDTRLRLQWIGAISSGVQIVLAGLMSAKLNDSLGPSTVHRAAMAVIRPALILPAVLRFQDMKFPKRSMSPAADVATLAGGAAVLGSLISAGRRSGGTIEEYFRFTSIPRSRAEILPKIRPVLGAKLVRSKIAFWGGIGLAACIAAYFALPQGRTGGRNGEPKDRAWHHRPGKDGREPRPSGG